MSEPESGSTATAPEKVVKTDNMSEGDFIQRRLAGKGTAKAESEAEKQKEVESTEKAEKPEAGEEAPEATKQDVLSKAKSGNLDDLSEDELSQLAKSIGSKAVARYGELTAKRKAAEERVRFLESELARRSDTTAKAVEEVKDNPFASIKDAAGLSEKAKEIKEVIEFAETRLDDSSDIGPDDIAATVDGKEYTKRQLRETLRRARKARDEYLPDVGRRLSVVENSKKLRVTMDEQTRKEIPWLEDVNDERKKQYDAIIADPRLKKLEEFAPDIAAQLPYFFAHASNSIYGRKEIALSETTPGKKPSSRPPENPESGAAASRKPESVQTKQIGELQSKFKASGDKGDWLKLRTAQISKRKVL
jgi:hypothetical protein